MINTSVNIVLENKSYSPGNTNFVTLTTNKSTHVVAYRNSYSKHVQIAPLILNSIHMHHTPLPLKMLLCGGSLLDILFIVLGQWNTPQSRSQMTAWQNWMILDGSLKSDQQRKSWYAQLMRPTMLALIVSIALWGPALVAKMLKDITLVGEHQKSRISSITFADETSEAAETFFDKKFITFFRNTPLKHWKHIYLKERGNQAIGLNIYKLP